MRNPDRNDTAESDALELREPGDSAAPADSATKPSVDAGTDSPAELRRQRDEYYELLLRTTAEFDNYRKRIERERHDLAETVAADLLQETLPIIDDLERALRSDPGTQSAEPYRRGVQIIHRQLLELLRKRGVRPLDTVGADFDPYYHQAVAQEVSPDRRDGEIIEEFQRGYMLGPRVLRPAMVKVAKA